MECSCSTSCDTCSCRLTQCGPMGGQCWLTPDQSEAREVVRAQGWLVADILEAGDREYHHHIGRQGVVPGASGHGATQPSVTTALTLHVDHLQTCQWGCQWSPHGYDLMLILSVSLITVTPLHMITIAESLLANQRPCKGDAWPIRGRYCDTPADQTPGVVTALCLDIALL